MASSRDLLRQRCVAGRIEASDVVVAVGSREIQRHRAGQVAGQLRPRHRIGRLGRGQEIVPLRVHEGGDSAGRTHVGRGGFERAGRVVRLDHEADRAEAFLAVQVAHIGCDPQQQRCRGARRREVRVGVWRRVEQYRAASAAAFAHASDQVERRRRLHGREDRRGSLRFRDDGPESRNQRIADLVHAGPPAAHGDAAARHVDVLWRSAHLRGEQVHRSREAAGDRLQVVHRLEHHRVHARGFRIAQRRVRILLDPGAEPRAAGEVHDRSARMLHQSHAERSLGAVNSEGHEVRVESGLREYAAGDSHGQRHGQDAGRMWLDDHRVAGREAGEHCRKRVPGREGRAGEADRDAARHEPEALLQPDRGRAEAPFPQGLGGDRGHRLVCIGDGLDAAVECIRAAARIAHCLALAGGVHHGGHQLRQLAEQGLHDLEADAHSRMRAGISPRGHGLARGIEQGIHIGPGVVDAEPLARVGRNLVAEPPGLARLVEFECATPLCLESRPTAFERGG